jgi:hypothetical protein
MQLKYGTYLESSPLAAACHVVIIWSWAFARRAIGLIAHACIISRMHVFVVSSQMIS